MSGAKEKTMNNPDVTDKPETPAASISASGSVRVGDRYHRPDKRATVEVMRVSETDVEYEVATEGDSFRFTVTLKDFLRLEAKSLEPNAEVRHPAT